MRSRRRTLYNVLTALLALLAAIAASLWIRSYWRSDSLTRAGLDEFCVFDSSDGALVAFFSRLENPPPDATPTDLGWSYDSRETVRGDRDGLGDLTSLVPKDFDGLHAFFTPIAGCAYLRIDPQTRVGATYIAWPLVVAGFGSLPVARLLAPLWRRRP